MKTTLVCLCLATGFLSAWPVIADTHHWTGGGSDHNWNNTNNWTGSGYPGGNDTVYIRTSNSAGNPVVVPSGSEQTCGPLRLGDNANTAGYLNLSGFLLTHSVYLGDNGGLGVMKLLSGGTHIPDYGGTDYDIYVGCGGTNLGTYSVDGGTLHLYENNVVHVSYGGRGRLEYFTDTIVFHDTSKNEIILNTSDTSTLAMGFDFDIPTLLSQPWLTINTPFTLEVTRNAAAAFNSGTYGVAVMQLGSATGAGTLNMGGGTWFPYDLYVGGGATGVVNHTSGTLNNGHMYLLNGGYALSGSGVLGASRTYLGHGAPGTFTQSGGTHSYDAYMIIGSATGGSGTYTITGGSLSGGSLQLGVAAPGRFEWFRGGSIHFSTVEFGTNGTLAMGTNFNVADLANGALYTGTAPTNLDLLQLEVTRGATATNSSGSATLGAFRLGGTAGAGTLIVTGGVFSVKGDISDGGSTSTLTIDGGTLDLQPSGDAVAGVIGNTGAPIDTLNFRSGTLKNVAEINSGATFQKTSSGVLVLDGTNSFSGNTTISTGTLRLGRPDVIPSGSGKGNVTVNDTLDLNTFNQTINGLSGGGTVDSIAGGSPTFTVGSNSAGGTFNGVITDSMGTVSLRKIGTGTLALTGPSTYAGVTAVENGVVQLLNDANRLPVTTVVTLGNSANSGKIILGDSFSGSDQTLAGLATSGTGTSNRVVGGYASSNATLTLNVASGTSGFAGFLGGPGANENNLALVKTGAGTMALGGSNTYSGLTTVSNGTLCLSNNFALGNTNTGTIVANGSRLELANNGMDAPEPLTLNGIGGGWGALRNVSGYNTWSGSITLNSDASIQSAAQTLTNNGSLDAAGFALTLGGSADMTINGPISGADSTLTKNGDTGIVTLTASNSFTGQTTVSNGYLRMLHPFALGSTNVPVTIVGAAWLDLQGGIGVGAKPLATAASGSTAHLRNVRAFPLIM